MGRPLGRKSAIVRMDVALLDLVGQHKKSLEEEHGSGISNAFAQRSLAKELSDSGFLFRKKRKVEKFGHEGYPF